MDPTTALGIVSGTADVIEKLATLKDKLRKNPDAAAASLGAALAEVRRTYLAIDSEVTRFLALGMNPAPFLEDKDNVQLLLELDGGAIRTRVNASRGHCHRIRNIYEKHLNKWFERVLSKTELLITQEVFGTLQVDDLQTYLLLEHVANDLATRARAVVDALQEQPPNETAARDLLRKASKDLRPLRDQLSTTVDRLGKLEAEFIDVSGAV